MNFLLKTLLGGFAIASFLGICAIVGRGFSTVFLAPEASWEACIPIGIAGIIFIVLIVLLCCLVGELILGE